MEEIVIGRVRRREGVGLVQEAANGDTGHQEVSASGLAGDVRLGLAKSASCEAIPFCMPRNQPRHCEPTGRANARQMTGFAKQSRARKKVWIASSRSLSSGGAC